MSLFKIILRYTFGKFFEQKIKHYFPLYSCQSSDNYLAPKKACFIFSHLDSPENLIHCLFGLIGKQNYILSRLIKLYVFMSILFLHHFNNSISVCHHCLIEPEKVRIRKLPDDRHLGCLKVQSRLAKYLANPIDEEKMITLFL